MMHMERDTGPTGPIAVLSGRRNGKTARGFRSAGAIQDEQLDRADSAVARSGPATNKRSKARQGRRFWERRYERVVPDAPRARRRPARVACPHAEVIWLERAHPRYARKGWTLDRLRTEIGEHAIVNIRRVVAVEGPHACVYGAVA